MSFLILYYDEYHTPLDVLSKKVKDAAVVLHIDLGQEEGALPVSNAFPELPTAWNWSSIDARDNYCDIYLSMAIKANARYEEGYYLSAALSRPLIAELSVEYARKNGADTVIHGFAGNDCVRFTAAVHALNPNLRLLNVATLIGSRTQANNNSYTISSNIWGRSIEAGMLADPWTPPDDDLFAKTQVPYESPNVGEDHVISFEHGVPIAWDSSRMSLRSIIEKLNKLGSIFGFGRSDIVEDGHVGLKTRAIYDMPAATALISAHLDLERFVSSRKQNLLKGLIDNAWTDLVYEGFWFDPARESLEAYIDSTNRWVTGDVMLRFRPRIVEIIGRRSKWALYDEAMAVYRAGHDFGLNTIQELGMMQANSARLAVHRDRSYASGKDVSPKTSKINMPMNRLG